MQRRDWFVVVRVVLLTVILVNVVPALVYVARSDEGFVQAGATWARDHGYGAIVDRIEHWRYSEPPSAEPADELGVSNEVLELVPTATSVPASAPVVSTTTIAPMVTTTTTTTWAPSPLPPVQSEALDGEGKWLPILEIGGRNAAWVTSIRPSAEYGSVRATYVRFDPSLMRGVLYNGSAIPGGNDWVNYRRVSGEALRDLVLTFNGGFRFEHTEGGYKVEGVVAEPLLEGQVSLAFDASGKATLGVYGRDLVDGPEWVSIRQNLPPIVDGGVSGVNSSNRGWWGSDYGGVTYVPRSALCDMGDGTLMWAIVGDTDADGLAAALVAAGCVVGMQLDINGTWPHFAVYGGLGTLERTPYVVDRRMGNPGRYLKDSEKDFFAFFVDPDAL